MILSDIANLNIKSADYCCIISQISHELNAKCWFDPKKLNILKHKSVLSRTKIGKENVSRYWNWKKQYHHSSLSNVDIEKVLVSNKVSLCEKNYKYFIGYLYNDYKDNELFEKNITIWNKVSPDTKKIIIW